MSAMRTHFYRVGYGRGDPTPPGKLAVGAKLHGTVKTVPYKLPEGKQLKVRQSFPGGCTGGIYAAPTDDPVFSRYHLTAGGACPAPTG